MLSEKTRWQGSSVIRNHHIAGTQQVHEFGPGLMLDMTSTVNDQYLRVGRALDWKIGGNHPIASCAIASESKSETRHDRTAATASASSRAATSGRFNVERSASGTAAACKGVSMSPGSIERTRTPSKRSSSSQMRLK